ncbi:MAG: HlyD family efflux transporter periplasmic adaptor subunit [Chloroflexi bacterium]|nr:MAG: HlyD family efflux transporter periplasmic adaptor subunit [Chloroflexota bacterium]
MNHKRPPVPAVIVIALLVIVSAYFIVTQTLGDGNGTLTASGTIEATIVNLSPEMAGKVKEVLVEEGQSVTMGDPVLILDDSLLAAQREVTQSGIASAQSALLTAQSASDMAQAQYDVALTAARAQEGSQRLADWSKNTPNWFEQPLWYFSQDEQIVAAQVEVEASLQALQQAQTDLESVIQNLSNANFVAAETRLSNARMGYLIAKSVDNHAQITGGKVSPEDVDVHIPMRAPSAYRVKIAIAKDMSGESDILNVSQDALDAADAELDEAEEAYKDLLTSDAANRVLEARAAVSVAQERYEVALDTLSSLQTGEYSQQVTIAAMGLEQAKTALGQAESAVHQAEANLALLDTQITKLTVYAPMDGVILTRNIEAGEFVQPGSIAFAMADLNNITITVYVPEDRYGQTTLGQQAQVTVDSFPGETFTAEVIHIADQAEFTPRNVQTVEGRSSTVYAIKLKVTDSEGKLKIGMPADVVFK